MAKKTTDDTPPILQPIPTDPGDAGGVGNNPERTFAKGTVHEEVGDVPAAEEAARTSGRTNVVPLTR